MAKSKLKIDKESQVLAEELFKLLGIKADIKVDLTKEADEQVVNVNIGAEEEAGLLIGAHGATLSAIQSFLAIALRQKTGEWARVVLDIGDWRVKHEEYLENLAKQAAQRARSTGESQHLYNLNPSQRRVIHMVLAKEEGVESESVGEGENRYLIVHPK